jgi:hypothetical protein
MVCGRSNGALPVLYDASRPSSHEEQTGLGTASSHAGIQLATSGVLPVHVTIRKCLIDNGPSFP